MFLFMSSNVCVCRKNMPITEEVMGPICFSLWLDYSRQKQILLAKLFAFQLAFVEHTYAKNRPNQHERKIRRVAAKVEI